MKLSLNDKTKRSIEQSFIELFFSRCVDIFIEKNEYTYSDENIRFNRKKVIYDFFKHFIYYYDMRRIFSWEIYLNDHFLISGSGFVNLYSTIN